MKNHLKTNSSELVANPFVTMKFANDDEGKINKLDKSIKQEGKNENTKNQAKKKEFDRQKLNNLVKKSNRCIVSISSLFPWNIFPNTIEVEEGRVNIITRQFMSSQSHSVDIKDISNVFIESSFFFATLEIVSRTYIKNNIKISYLKKDEAKRAKMIIEGLRTFKSNDIDTSSYEVAELINKLEELETNTHRPEVGESQVA